jgi:hypothetical protein
MYCLLIVIIDNINYIYSYIVCNENVTEMFKIKSLLSNTNTPTRGRPPAIVTQPQTLEECAALLKQQGAAVAVLAVQDLQAYWLKIMSDNKASNKDKLAASKLYADSIGAFDKQTHANKGPAVYHWGAAEEAVVVNDCSEDTTKTQT